MWSVSKGAARIAIRQQPLLPRATSIVAVNTNPSLNHHQIRWQHPTSRRKCGKLREQREKRKLAKLALIASGEWTPPPVPKFTIAKSETLPILLSHCQNRDIFLNKRQRLKPWIMCLMVHRYDKGVRDLDELNAGGLRHVLTPAKNVVLDYIHATTTESTPNRFTKRNQKIAREIIRNQKMSVFCEEAWRAMTERKIPPPIPVPEMKKKITDDPGVFLSLFARAFCQAEPDGAMRNDLLTVSKRGNNWNGIRTKAEKRQSNKKATMALKFGTLRLLN